jgi:hypothetical protein
LIDFVQKQSKLRRRYSIELSLCALLGVAFFYFSLTLSKTVFAQPSNAAVQFIPVYVEPYYVAGKTVDEAPRVKVWSEIDGLLASMDRESILAAKRKIEADPTRVSPMALMVLAVRLFDMGLRDDAVFWFYVAKERYFVTEKVLNIRSPELASVGDAINGFHVLAGPFINGYAFCNPDNQIKQREAATAWNERNTYAALALESLPARAGDRSANLQLALTARRESLNKEQEYLAKPETRAELTRARKANGADEKYCKFDPNAGRPRPAAILAAQKSESHKPSVTRIELDLVDESTNGLAKGSLANEKLISDAKVGVVAKAAMRGCANPSSFQPYTVAQPVGAVGSRMWLERWLVMCADGTRAIDIEFRETGAGSAMWTIPDPSPPQPKRRRLTTAEIEERLQGLPTGTYLSEARRNMLDRDISKLAQGMGCDAIKIPTRALTLSEPVETKARTTWSERWHLIDCQTTVDINFQLSATGEFTYQIK